MPWVAAYMVIVALLAAVALREGDRRGFLGLLFVLAMMPATFLLYNVPRPFWIPPGVPVGALWAGALWAFMPWIVLGQWLRLWTPAILGEVTALAYIFYAFGWASEWPAQITADLVGWAMIACLGGPSIVSFVDRITGPRPTLRRVGHRLARVRSYPKIEEGQ